MTSPATLRVTVHFLQPYSHGRGEDGFPEWPPSPLRLFQALVAASARSNFGPKRRESVSEALRWLERQPPPEIVAPSAELVSTPHRLFVPDNSGDVVARAWSARRDANLADYRTEKDVRPLRLAGHAVHYEFGGADGVGDYLHVLRTTARSITHLGWGIDMVVGEASDETGRVAGERWIPGRRGGPMLRVPVPGTFDALAQRHHQFLHRIDGDTFRPVAPLSTFTAEAYSRATDELPRPFAAFRMIEPITGDRLSFDPPRRSRDVAAWMRHAVAEVCQNWPFGSAATLLHGHVEGGEEPNGPRMRLSFLPLPTINPRLGRAEGIGRVVICAPCGHEEQVAWAGRRVAGTELAWNGTPQALLEPLPQNDWVLRRYVGTSDRWSTVTPVVLPGHDDRSDRKAEQLLRKAFCQAGYEREVVDTIKELEWRKVGFRSGVAPATRYLPPDKVIGPMFHVRVRFATFLTGPIAIGSGRYRGTGVFAID